jgi:hypothetical protein
VLTIYTGRKSVGPSACNCFSSLEDTRKYDVLVQTAAGAACMLVYEVRSTCCAYHMA